MSNQCKEKTLSLKQTHMLPELHLEEYEELWDDIPGDDMVEVVLLQVGNVGGEPDRNR